MNANQRIWAVIVGILFVGIAVTSFTNKYINKQNENLMSDAVYESYSDELTATTDSVEDGNPEPAAPYGTGKGRMSAGAKNRTARISEAPLNAALSSSESMEENDQPKSMNPQQEGSETDQMEFSEEYTKMPQDAEAGTAAMLEISPIDPGAAALAVNDDEDKKNQGYMERLSELDLQIKRMREDSADSSTYAMKIMFEKELQLWDAELNSVYNIIIEQLDEEQKSDLIQDEREWMKVRDAKAAEAAKKYSGGSLEGVEYSASLAETTRQRTYELVGLYLENPKQNP